MSVTIRVTLAISDILVLTESWPFISRSINPIMVNLSSLKGCLLSKMTNGTGSNPETLLWIIDYFYAP